MALKDDERNRQELAYAESVRQSPGARFLRGELGFQQSRDAKMANIGRAMQANAPKPIASPAATPIPAAPNRAVAAPSFPGVRFAGIDAAPDNFYRNPPGTKPRTAAELNQASQAEVAARASTQPPAPPTTGAGAPSTVGGAAPVIRSRGKFGETVFSNTGSQYGNAAGTIASPSTTVGSVNQQNFGNAAVPQAPGSIARPGIASTFGLSVNDPRIDDQRAIARPQLGPNQLAGGGTLRGPDAMAEQYNSREDREARKAVSGNIDTALFLARGKPNSGEVMSNLLETQARLNSGAEGLSQEAIQNRANRSNAYGIAGLNDAGETARAGIAADTARRGQSLNFDATMADIARPQYREDKDGNVFSVSGTNATAVARPDGSQLQGRVEQQAQGQQRNFQQESEAKLFADLLANQVDATGNPLPNAVDTALAQLQKYKAAQGVGQAAAADPYQDGAIIKGPNGRMRYNAKTNAFEPVK